METNMIERISNCRKCGLCINQKPLLDAEKNCQLFWVGLSARKAVSEDESPLSPLSPSGQIIQEAEKALEGAISYKTNLVKCLPLTEVNKIRYPSRQEIDCCFDNLLLEFHAMAPKVVFLLGKQVALSMERHLGTRIDTWTQFSYRFTRIENTCYVPVQHPSYISVYARNKAGEYIRGIKDVYDRIANAGMLTSP